MNIQGLQKLTLLDFPEHVACTVFLGGCNFRCPFCHNFELVSGPLPSAIPEREFDAFLDKRSGILDGVAVTGGEPCLRTELPEFLESIKKLGFAIKLDTNGSNPEMLAEIINRGLVNYIAMDIKASRANYAAAIGLREFDIGPIEASVKLLMVSDVPYEFRTTVVGGLHTLADFEDIGQWLSGAERYFLQPFVEAESVPDKRLSTPSSEQIEAYRGVVSRFVEHVSIRGIA